MKTLGVDFGERRIGLAISDPAGRWALPLATIKRSDDRSAIEAIAAVARREAARRLVIGEPLRLDGTRGDAAHRVRSFAAKLSRATGLPCTYVDEALTSRRAEERLRETGIDPRRHPERVDQLAAQILLQEALDTALASEHA